MSFSHAKIVPWTLLWTHVDLQSTFISSPHHHDYVDLYLFLIMCFIKYFDPYHLDESKYIKLTPLAKTLKDEPRPN
jgi:hypothetical protein